MKKLFILLTICLLPLYSTASGKDPGYFPKIDSWKTKVIKEVHTPDNLWDLINGGAEVFVAHGFVDLHRADYIKKKEGCMVHVEVYRFAPGNNANEMFAQENSPDYEHIDLGKGAYIMEGILNFITGNYYVKLYSNDQGEAVQDALMLIASEVALTLEAL